MSTDGDESASAPGSGEVTKTDRGGRAATVVGIGILLSRLTGFVRGYFMAKFFGLGLESDAFIAASKVPNVMRSLFGEGALSASFVPVYSRMLARGDTKAANALAGAILGLLMVAVSVFTLVGVAAAPLLTTIFNWSFEGEKRELTIRLTQILFPMTAFMVLSGWCLGVQNSHRRFFWSYASAAMWNVAQIVLLFGWGDRAQSMQQLAIWLAWATLVGSLLQVAAQLPEVSKLVRPFRISLDRTVEGVADTMRNVGPVVVALGVVQISGLIDMQIGGLLPHGGFTSLANANGIVLLPVALFGISVAASSLPEFARESSPDATAALLERLRGGWQRILFYIIPSAVACIAYGDLIVGILYRTGKFGAPEQRLVHAVLAAYAIGLVSSGSVKLLSSVHYALKDYRTPLRASVASLVVSAIISLICVWPFRHSLYGAVGIALGSALGSYVNLTVQIAGLRKKLGQLYTAPMWNGTRRIVIATIAASLTAAPLRYWLGSERPRVGGPPTLIVFALTYLVIAWLMGSGEAARWLRRPVRGGARAS